MTPTELREARQQLGLTLEQMATLLGYSGDQRRQMMHKLETGLRELRPAQERLVQAYLSGHRPKDWPLSR
jgi:transcriptional regulator with XRE-family HTH domain